MVSRPPKNDDNEAQKDPAEFPGWSNLSGGKIARRTMVKTAAWSAPVIALAVATPLAAASPITTMDLALTSLATVTNFAFTEAPNSTAGGTNAWNDNQPLHNYVTLQNTGTATIPARSTFTVTYPAVPGGNRAFSDPTVSDVQLSTVPGASTSTITPAGPATVSNGAVTRTFVVGVEIPPGTGFTTQLLSTVAPVTTGTYPNLTINGTAQLPDGQTDANPGNNAGTGPQFTITGHAPAPVSALAITSLHSANNWPFNETPNSTAGGTIQYKGGQTLHNVVTIANTGNQTIPAGSTVTLAFGGGSAGEQLITNTSVDSVQGGSTGLNSSNVTAGPGSVSNGRFIRTFTFGASIPVGANFTVTMATILATITHPGGFTGITVTGTVNWPGGSTGSGATGPQFTITP